MKVFNGLEKGVRFESGFRGYAAAIDSASSGDIVARQIERVGYLGIIFLDPSNACHLSKARQTHRIVPKGIFIRVERLLQVVHLFRYSAFGERISRCANRPMASLSAHL